VSASTPVDTDAGNVQFHARPAIPIPVLVAVTIAVIPLVNNNLVPVTLAEASRSADVLAANFAAHAGDGFGDAQLLDRAAQASRASRVSGIRLTQ
jgi:hypothetical protein